jgi:hypothetical protein
MSTIATSSQKRSDRLPWYSPRSWVWRLLVPALALGALAGWVWWNTAGGPREADRVQHPAGYSIVKPRGWLARMQVKPNDTARDAITLIPEKWISLEPTIWAKRLLSPPDFEKLHDTGYVEGEFQGHKAWLSQQKPKRRIERLAIFQAGSDWYQVGVSLPGLEGARVDDWWEYAKTFRPGSSKPASGPSTATTEGT